MMQAQQSEAPDPTTVRHDPSIVCSMNHCERVTFIISKYVETSHTKRLLSSMACANLDDELACAEVVDLMKNLEGRDLEECINSMVTYLLNATENLTAIDHIVTKVLFKLHEQKAAPVLPIAYGLINSLDVLRFKVPINARKINFVRKHLKEIDYKGMRDLLKLVLVEKLDRGLKHHGELHDHQRIQLLPLEDLTIGKFLLQIHLRLDLLDRYNNFYPSLFIITEVVRIYGNSAVHKLPRLSKTICDVVASFRPLADVLTMICRPWTFPVVSMVTYSFTGNTWRLSEQGYRAINSTHLPYYTFVLTAQSYFPYVILKQPRSQQYLYHVSKRVNNYKCDDLLHILIIEAMVATENSKKPINDEQIQYNWRHLSHMCCYALTNRNVNFGELLMTLNKQLAKGKFEKSRAELMWLLLQFVGVARQQLAEEKLAELFTTLYPEDMTWTGSSGDTFGLVRFFVPAAIWMNLNRLNGNDNNAPDKINRQIQYIPGMISNAPDDGFLAVVANANCNDDTVFNTEVCPHFAKKFNSNKPGANYILPFNIVVPCVLDALEIKFLDLLTLSAKSQLFTYIMFNYFNPEIPNKWPSPAVVETLTRLVLSSETILSTKHSHSPMNALSQRLRTQDRFTSIFMDMFAYRLKNQNFPSALYRFQMIMKVMDFLPPPTSPISRLPQYVLVEQIILRQAMTLPCFEFIPVIILSKSIKLLLFSPPEKFGSETNICPEVIRLLFYQFIMAVKLVADCNGVTSLQFPVDMIRKSNKFPECTIKWMPECMSEIQPEPTPDADECAQLERAADAELGMFMTLDSNAAQTQPSSPHSLIVLFRASMQQTQIPMSLYKTVKSMTIIELTVCLNKLVDYLILKLKAASSDAECDKMVAVLHQLIFRRPGIPLERFLLALIVHPNDNKSIKIALILLHTLLTKPDPNNGIVLRLHFLYSYVPSTFSYFQVKSADFFTKQADYNRSRADQFGEPDPQSDNQILLYYSNLAERLVPLIDLLFMRCFEVNTDDIIVDELVKHFGPLYKYHPQPITALYKMVFCLEHNYKSDAMMRLVRCVAKSLDDDVQPKYPFMTPDFMHGGHSGPAIKVCAVILDRIVQACTYEHEPPDFVIHDWRLSEFTPASQAVTSGCLELMVSPKPAKEVVEALVACMMQRPMDRPYDRQNAAAITLAHLPKHYQVGEQTTCTTLFQAHFYHVIERSFDWRILQDCKPDYLLSSYNIEVMQYKDDRLLTLLSLVQCYIQHACCDSLAHLCHFIEHNLAPKVNNESQLIYFLRILAAYLNKSNERDDPQNKREMSMAYLNLIHTIYEMIPRILKKQPVLQYEDLVCDMLYQFKYTVTGFSVASQKDDAFNKFPFSMLQKLKFLQTQGVKDMNSINSKMKKTVPHSSLLQVLHAHGISTAEHQVKLNDRQPSGLAIHPGQMQHHPSAVLPPQQQPQHPAFPPNLPASQMPPAMQQPHGQNPSQLLPQNFAPQSFNPQAGSMASTPAEAPFQGNPFQHNPALMPSHPQFARQLPPQQPPQQHMTMAQQQHYHQQMMQQQYQQQQQQQQQQQSGMPVSSAQMPPPYPYQAGQMGMDANAAAQQQQQQQQFAHPQMAQMSGWNAPPPPGMMLYQNQGGVTTQGMVMQAQAMPGQNMMAMQQMRAMPPGAVPPQHAMGGYGQGQGRMN